MKKSNNHILILVLGLVMTGIQTEIRAENQTNLPGQKDSFAKQDSFSPRQYCRSTGGIVSETATPHVYLCCYAQKNKCVVSDTKASVSWLLPYM